MSQCSNGIVGGMTVATARYLRRQAATCASMAKQTRDEECRQRCLRLEQTYLQLAESEEQLARPMNVLAGASEEKPAA
jgi:hypothetical protein